MAYTTSKTLQIYIRKLFPHDITHEVSVTWEIVYNFFDKVTQRIPFIIKGNSTTIHYVDINSATEPRFGGNFKKMLPTTIQADDIIAVRKYATYFELEYISPSDPQYPYLAGLLVGQNGHRSGNAVLLSEIIHPTVPPLDEPLQQIFYGAPGTGKSHKVDEKCKMYSNHRTTFHPDSDYSTFVGCYKPTKDKDDTSQITYAFTPQAFTRAYIEAWEKFEKNEPVLLVIEEINRGNCAQIFGDLFQLLDRNDDGYSTYPIEPDTDLSTYIRDDGNLMVQNAILKKKDGTTIDISEDINSGKKLVLPPNLYIWATMNTSDQSLFPIDSAFKRRWDWKYVPIRKKDENYKIEIQKEVEEDGKKVKKTFRYDWWEFLDRVNTAIGKATSSEDKKLGYFFCKASKKINEADKEPQIITADSFVGKVVFYLWNDVFKDYEIGDAKFKYTDKDGKEYNLSLLSTMLGDEEVKREFSSFFDELGNAKHEVVAQLFDDLKVKCELVTEGKEVEDGGSNEKVTTAETFQE